MFSTLIGNASGKHNYSTAQVQHQEADGGRECSSLSGCASACIAPSRLTRGTAEGDSSFVKLCTIAAILEASSDTYTSRGRRVSSIVGLVKPRLSYTNTAYRPVSGINEQLEQLNTARTPQTLFVANHIHVYTCVQNQSWGQHYHLESFLLDTVSKLGNGAAIGVLCQDGTVQKDVHHWRRQEHGLAPSRRSKVYSQHCCHRLQQLHVCLHTTTSTHIGLRACPLGCHRLGGVCAA